MRFPVWKSAAPWFKVEIYNMLNNQKQIAWDKTVTVNRAGALDANGIPVDYIKGARASDSRPTTNQFPQPYAGQKRWPVRCGLRSELGSNRSRSILAGPKGPAPTLPLA